MSAMTASKISTRLRKLADRQRAQECQRFFKTGPGDYAEGDIFLGIRTPDLRKLAAEYQDLSIGEVFELLNSAFHEERALALLILIQAYKRGDEAAKKQAYELYVANTRLINNWDLVDLSAPHIV